MLRARRPIMLALAFVSASVLLTACAGPDLDELETDAAAIFDTLVEAAGAVEEGTLRTLETTGPEEQSCGEQDRGTQRTFAAVGSVSVGADYAAEDALVDAVTAAIEKTAMAPSTCPSETPSHLTKSRTDRIRAERNPTPIP